MQLQGKYRMSYLYVILKKLWRMAYACYLENKLNNFNIFILRSTVLRNNPELHKPAVMDPDKCLKILSRVLACQLDYCTPLDGHIICYNLKVFESHVEECTCDCVAVRIIDHARSCETNDCEITCCDEIKAKLSFPPDSCLHLIINKLEIALLFESDGDDHETFTTKLMELNNDETNNDSDSDTEEFPPSMRRIRVLNLEALDYWTHVDYCRDNDCDYSNGSISCERKRNIIKLHRNYCTYQTCKNCMLIQKFLIRHTRTCNERDCPAPRCNDMRNGTKVLRSKSTGAARPKYEPPKI